MHPGCSIPFTVMDILMDILIDILMDISSIFSAAVIPTQSNGSIMLIQRLFGSGPIGYPSSRIYSRLLASIAVSEHPHPQLVIQKPLDNLIFDQLTTSSNWISHKLITSLNSENVSR